MTEQDNKYDEIIDVRLPRADYERLRTVLERERTYDWFQTTVKNNWIFLVAGGILAIWGLYEKIIHFLGVPIKV